MLAIGDALALVVSEARDFRVQDFAELHPGGSLGRKLAIVNEVMRPVLDCRLASSQTTIRKMLVDVSRPGRRTGAVMLVNAEGKLEGIFTDSDLARLLEQRREGDLDMVISNLMTRTFSAVQSGAKLMDAIDIMVQHKISELPVVDANDKPLGMIDITDVLGLEHEAARDLQRHPSESTSELVDEEKDPVDWHDGPSTLRLFGPNT